MSEAADPALVAVRFLTYALAIAIFGAAFFPVYAPTRARDGWGTGRIAPAGLALVALAYLVLLAREMSEATGWPRPGVIVELIVATMFGRALAITAAAGLTLIVVSFLSRGRRWARLLASGAALASLAFIGHAADGVGLAGASRLGLMAVHLLAVGAWLGALAPLSRALAKAGSATPHLLERFGAVAAVAVSLVVATGLAILAFIAADAHWALGPSYRQALVMKLAFVAGLLAIAAVNRFRLTPMARREPARAGAALRRAIVLEQALGLGAVASVALLGQLDPTM